MNKHPFAINMVTEFHDITITEDNITGEVCDLIIKEKENEPGSNNRVSVYFDKDQLSEFIDHLIYFRDRM